MRTARKTKLQKRSKTQENEIVIIFNIFWSAKSFVLSQMQITPLFYIIYESYKKKSSERKFWKKSCRSFSFIRPLSWRRSKHKSWQILRLIQTIPILTNNSVEPPFFLTVKGGHVHLQTSSILVQYLNEGIAKGIYIHNNSKRQV